MNAAQQISQQFNAVAVAFARSLSSEINIDIDTSDCLSNVMAIDKLLPVLSVISTISPSGPALPVSWSYSLICDGTPQ